MSCFATATTAYTPSAATAAVVGLLMSTKEWVRVSFAKLWKFVFGYFLYASFGVATFANTSATLWIWLEVMV